MILALSSRDKARTLRASVEELDEEAGGGGGGGRRRGSGDGDGGGGRRRRSSIAAGPPRRTSAVGMGRAGAEMPLAIADAKPRINEKLHPRAVFSGLLGGGAARSGAAADVDDGGGGDGARRGSTAAGMGDGDGARRSSAVGAPAALRSERQAKRISEYQRNYSRFRQSLGAEKDDDEMDMAGKQV